MGDSPRRVRVRMAMAAETAAAAQAELDEHDGDGLLDRLWLRSVFVEQRRRTRIAERARFDARADRILARLEDREADA